MVSVGVATIELTLISSHMTPCCASICSGQFTAQRAVCQGGEKAREVIKTVGRTVGRVTGRVLLLNTTCTIFTRSWIAPQQQNNFTIRWHVVDGVRSQLHAYLIFMIKHWELSVAEVIQIEGVKNDTECTILSHDCHTWHACQIQILSKSDVVCNQHLNPVRLAKSECEIMPPVQWPFVVFTSCFNNVSWIADLFLSDLLVISIWKPSIGSISFTTKILCNSQWQILLDLWYKYAKLHMWPDSLTSFDIVSSTTIFAVI